MLTFLQKRKERIPKAEARSLADIKLDNAYKFGAGRYIQEAGALRYVGEEARRQSGWAARPWSSPVPGPGKPPKAR